MRLSVTIDRLVFRDGDMSERRAGRIRDLVEIDLRSRLMQSGAVSSITEGHHAHLAAAPMNTPLGSNENQIARRLTDRIAGAITGVKG